jgi:carbonic anhydrase
LHRGPVNNAVRQNVIEQVNSLHDLDPILHQNNTDGEILIVGAVNDIHTVKVEVYRRDTFKSSQT